ncbi:arylsulfatase I-like [Haliotis rufescens]|uniref:arylsulfatase I-like n=1 Tax=Haliotis rufescens TaxID=6454 RepID=UPI00201F03A5|nr:arylsulfatase I-like [Haliotis rufescens]
MKTPNIDKLATEGIIFENAYVQPYCSPSRTAFMSGMFPFKVGMQHAVLIDSQASCVPLNYTFLPQELKKLGYATHMVGKYVPQAHYNTVFVAYDIGFLIYTFAQKAVYIINQHEVSQPPFMYLPYQNVHAPIEEICEAVGNVTKALKEKGLFENTLILFTTDNGGPLGNNANNWPLRGGKHTIWEGGTRGTSFMYGTGLKKTKTTYNGMIHAVDWNPTLVSAAGGTPEASIDGTTHWESIRNGLPSSRTEFIYNIDDFEPALEGHAAIRVGDYKLILGYPGELMAGTSLGTLHGG